MKKDPLGKKPTTRRESDVGEREKTTKTRWRENGKTYGKEKAGFIPVGGTSDSGGRTIEGRVPWAGVLPTFQGGQYLKVLRPTMFSTGTRAGAPMLMRVSSPALSVCGNSGDDNRATGAKWAGNGRGRDIKK